MPENARRATKNLLRYAAAADAMQCVPELVALQT
jgi:hypothetical protein